MKVQVLNDSGEILWSYDHQVREGFTSTQYLKDGTQNQIVTALEMAHQQATGEQVLAEEERHIEEVAQNIAAAIKQNLKN